MVPRIAILAVAMTVGGVAPAAEDRAGHRQFSVSPMFGYRAGGRFDEPVTDERVRLDDDVSYGLALRFEPSPGRLYELYYSRQNTNVERGGLGVNVEYLHVGGMLSWPQGAFSTFFGGGLGGTRFNPRAPGLGAHTRPSMSLGVGLEFPMSDRLAFRLEARGFLTFTADNREVFCFSGPADAFCELRYEGSVFTQVEALTGLTWRF